MLPVWLKKMMVQKEALLRDLAGAIEQIILQEDRGSRRKGGKEGVGLPLVLDIVQKVLKVTGS